MVAAARRTSKATCLRALRLSPRSCRQYEDSASSVAKNGKRAPAASGEAQIGSISPCARAIE